MSSSEASMDNKINDAFEAMALHLAGGGTLGDLRGLTESHYEAIYAAGYAQYNAGRYDQAEKVFQFLSMYQPYDRRFPMALASVKQVKGDYAEAIGYYGMASVLDMMDPVPLFHSAECLAALGRTDDAVEALGFVIRNANQPDTASYKQRAEAMIGILKNGEVAK